MDVADGADVAVMIISPCYDDVVAVNKKKRSCCPERIPVRSETRSDEPAEAEIHTDPRLQR
jgi:hypothetical protein